MSVERIATELDDRFRLLTGGARTVVARQQTLAASVDWSHDRLDEAERRVFRRLGVFVGPFPLDAAETVAAAGGGVETAEVFELLSRLVDRSLIVGDEGPRGETHYRLLETLRAYALDRARTAAELSAVRDAHASWWADWLEPRGGMPTDDVLQLMDEFHGNLKAAVAWSVEKPALGLRLLRGVARAWDAMGRASDAMAAADHLLTDDNADRYAEEWLPAANNSAQLYLASRGTDGREALLERIERVAGDLNDEYHLMLARWQWSDDYYSRVRELARQRGDDYVASWMTIVLAQEIAENEPSEAAPWLCEAKAAASASGVRYLLDEVGVVNADAAATSGELGTAIELATAVVARASFAFWWSASRSLSFAALLACDREALRFAAGRNDRALLGSPGYAEWAEFAAHRLDLLEGRPSVVRPGTRLPVRVTHRVTAGTQWLEAREALDAGEASAAVEYARRHGRAYPHPQAVVAAIEAAATGNEDRWHDALGIAVEQGLRLIAVDALEGLAAAAARSESWSESMRLLGAAERLRDETGYRWRFGFEQRAVTDARTASLAALGDDAEAAELAGRNLDWRKAAAYARRARGERKRPGHGWASLTPTELQVVSVVSEGLTNPQIAERLLMGRATVKTHLEHIFTKLGMRTRAELAAASARRSTTPR